MGDETWVYEFDMQTSQQASEWRFDNEPKPKKPRQNRSGIPNSQQTILAGRYEAFERECLPEKARFVEEQFLDFAP